MEGRKHTPDQIVRKLREADRLFAGLLMKAGGHDRGERPQECPDRRLVLSPAGAVCHDLLDLNTTHANHASARRPNSHLKLIK